MSDSGVGYIEMGNAGPCQACYQLQWDFSNSLLGYGDGRIHNYNQTNGVGFVVYDIDDNFYANNLILAPDPPGCECPIPGQTLMMYVSGCAAAWQALVDQFYAQLPGLIAGGGFQRTLLVYAYNGVMQFRISMVLSVQWKPDSLFVDNWGITESVYAQFQVRHGVDDLGYYSEGNRNEILYQTPVPQPDGTGAAAAAGADVGAWFYSIPGPGEDYANPTSNLPLVAPAVYSTSSGSNYLYGSWNGTTNPGFEPNQLVQNFGVWDGGERTSWGDLFP